MNMTATSDYCFSCITGQSYNMTYDNLTRDLKIFCKLGPRSGAVNSHTTQSQRHSVMYRHTVGYSEV